MEIITQKEIGARISELRKNKGYSQDELAKLLGISRPPLTQIELGKRNISVIELQKISENLSISMDKLLSPDFKIEDVVINFSQKEKSSELRISKPNLNIDKFKSILLYMLEKCAGKSNVGEAVVHKLLYFADFNYYEIYEEHLSGAAYTKLAYGPSPHHFDSIINGMITNNMLKRITIDYHGLPQTRFLPLVKPDLTILKASEKEVIDRVIIQYADWSSAAITDYSHNDMPWLASKDGEILDYELVFYRTSPYAVRTYDYDPV